MVTFKGSTRFFSRSSAGKFQLDVREIRSAIEQSAGLPERIRQWRDERLGRLVANDGPIPLISGALLVMHVVPLESFTDEWRFVAAELDDRELDFSPIDAAGRSKQFNIDGMLTYSKARNNNNSAETYTQVFRSGRIEAVTTDFLSEKDGQPFIASVWYEEQLMRYTKIYTKSLEKLDVQPPVAVLLSIIGAKGAYMEISPRYLTTREQRAIDRDMLLLPDVLMLRFDCDIPSLLRPVFDAIWNACGYPKSLNYDENGQWREHGRRG